MVRLTHATPEVVAAFDALPQGTFDATAHGRPYIVTRTALADGRAQKLVAEEKGGGDYISLNLYRLGDGGARLFPCEMPLSKVTAFLMALRPDPAD